MSHKEAFKVIVGMAVWDFLIALWIITSGSYPITFFWIKFSLAWIIVVACIDFAIIIVLGYFAWVRKEKKKKTSGNKSRRKKRK